MWRLLAPLVLLAAAISAAVVLDSPAPRADLVIINRGDVSTLDIHRMSWLQDLRLAGALFEGLVRPDAHSPDFRPAPAAAQRWEVSPDGRTYTFHLRENLTWSNGARLTAADFRRTWFRAIVPDTGGDYLNIFGLIQGVPEFVAWRNQALRDFANSDRAGDPAAAEALWTRTLAAYDQMVRVRSSPDGNALEIRLVRPIPYFLDALGYEITAPLYMPVVEQFQRLDPRTGRMILDAGWTTPANLVCNGPFTLESWRFKREMRLARNPRYWNAAGVDLASISLPTVDDPTAAVIAARTGAADWLTDVSAECRRDLLAARRDSLGPFKAEVERLAAQGLDPLAIDRALPPDPRRNVHVLPAFGTYFLNLNCLPTLPGGRPNPLADARVRRALALAVDKRAVAEIRGIGEPIAGSLTPPGSIPGYTPPSGLGHDAAQARALLAAAGFEGGRGLPPIEILFNKDAGHDVVAQSIAKDWQRELGLSVSLRQKERKVFREDLKNRNYMVSTANWFGDYGDPTTFLDINRAADGNNDRGYADAAFEVLLNTARDQTDPATRLELLRQAEQLLVEDGLPLIPLVHECSVYLFDAHRLAGISAHPRQKQQIGFLRRLDRAGE